MSIPDGGCVHAQWEFRSSGITHQLPDLSYAAYGRARNAFGFTVEQFVTPNGQEQFWSQVYFRDSDADGFSNGTELGDPNGTGIALWSTGFSHPANLASRPNPPNLAPTITSSAVTNGMTGVLCQYQVTATDFQGGALTYSLRNPSSFLRISASGLVSGTPGPGQAGVYTNIVQVTDNAVPANTTEQEYTLTISMTPDDPPVISSTPVMNATIGLSYQYQISATDPEGGLLSYSLHDSPGWLSVSTNGLVSGVPPDDQSCSMIS